MSELLVPMGPISEDIYKENEQHRLPARDMLVGSIVSYFFKPPIVISPKYYLGDLLVDDIQSDPQNELYIVSGLVNSKGKRSGPHPIVVNHEQFAIVNGTGARMGFFGNSEIDAGFHEEVAELLNQATSRG